jgi:hypothetical protein
MVGTAPVARKRNLAKLRSNRSRSEAMRAVRNGAALLAGLMVCGKCGWRMNVWYGYGRYTYACKQKASHYGGRVCQHIAGPVLDDYVSGWVLEVLEPAALELSLEAANNLQRERDDLNQLWQERLERSTYEADRAETPVPSGGAGEPPCGAPTGAGMGGEARSPAEAKGGVRPLRAQPAPDALGRGDSCDQAAFGRSRRAQAQPPQ